MMLRGVLITFGIVLGFLFLPFPVDAQESSDGKEVIPVEPVVVTATRTEVPLSQVTASVTVITREQLEKRQFPYLRDVLRDVPGLTIVQTGSRGGTTSLFTRGGESDYTMVLVDGVKVNDAGGGFEFANLTTDNVERIEIVKGPQSALYGSDAIGGVINIVTRKGSGPAKLVGEVMGGLGRGIGSNMQTHQERVSVSGSSDRLDYSAEWTRFDHAGLFGLNNKFLNNVFSGNFGLRASDKLQLRTTFRYTDSQFQFPTDFVSGVGFPPVDPNQGQERTLLSFGTSATYQVTSWWEHVLQWSHMESRFKFFDFRDPIPSDFGSSQTDGTQRRDMLDYHTNFRVREGIWSGTAATFGVEFQEERLSQSSIGFTSTATNLSRRNMGYYAQLQGVYADRVFITPGIRVEENEFFGQFINPKISGAYIHKETGTKLRASLGRGIRAPAFNELIGFPNFGIPSNFNLKPEKATSWEVGLDQDLLGKQVTVSLTWFHNDFSNLIVLNTGVNTNIQGAETQGLESTVRWRATNELTFSGTHTYLKTQVTDIGPGQNFGGLFVPGGRLLRRPEHSGNVQADYQTRTWGLNLMVLGVGDRVDRDFALAGSPRVKNTAYWRADVSGWYWLGKFEGADWKAKLRVENLTDTHYQEAFGFPNPGVFALAGLEASF
ncbi:MAG: TonB-dependent receptor plug domain-containing protein [Nitrospiraceae bacterium]